MGGNYLAALIPSIGMQTMAGPLITQGKSFFVLPHTGSDGYRGNRPDRAFSTLYGAGAGSLGALNAATANQNDVVYFMSEHNDTTAYTTDYQSNTTGAALTWSKDQVHLIGVNAGNAISQRSRIALASTFATAIPMVEWSADACLCANMQFYEGVTSTAPTGCVKVSGSRNHFVNCNFAGMMGATHTNDIDNAFSLWVTGAENLFENCVIGSDSQARGYASNFSYELILGPLTGAGSAARNIFRNCTFMSNIVSATKHPFIGTIVADPFGTDSSAIFDNCKFIATSINYAVTQTYAVKNTVALTAGGILIHNPAPLGVAAWAAAGNKVYVSGGTATLTGYNQALGYTA
jgi:hypothetical protein